MPIRLRFVNATIHQFGVSEWRQRRIGSEDDDLSDPPRVPSHAQRRYAGCSLGLPNTRGDSCGERWLARASNCRLGAPLHAWKCPWAQDTSGLPWTCYPGWSGGSLRRRASASSGRGCTHDTRYAEDGLTDRIHSAASHSSYTEELRCFVECAWLPLLCRRVAAEVERDKSHH